MAASFIQETDVIDVSSLCVLFYGQPGCWKTSLAQTADKPLTLDFDKGLHRSFNRKAGFRFDRWSDVGLAEVQAQIARHQTIVVDTIGRALDLLALEIAGGSATRPLTIKEWGTLKGRFAQWVNHLRQANKDVVFIAHEKEEKEGDQWYSRPDVQGGSYGELMKFTDIVGYLTVGDDAGRVLDCNPTRRHMGKNAAGWEPRVVPSLKEQTRFLAELLTDAKQRIGNVAQLSAQIAQAVAEWSEFYEDEPALEEVNDTLPEIKAIESQPVRIQVWGMTEQYAKGKAWLLDVKAKKFYHPEAQSAVPSNGVPLEAAS